MAMRVYMTKPFARFQRRERISDAALCAAVDDAEAGLIDADLGGGLIKQRIARPGQGKRGGYRTVIAYRRAGLAVFLLGFAKSTRANIDPEELGALKHQAAAMLTLANDQIEALIADDKLTEVYCG
jgi:hypothetical protein